MIVRLKDPQWKVFNCSARNRILVAGRRFGKTFLAGVELCRAAWGPGRLAWYVAPTYRQAKRVAWKPLKELTRPYWATKPNETDLRIDLTSGGSIALRGADNPDSLRGNGLDFLVLDEYAQISPEAWTKVLRPSLADRQGRALFIGTPQGTNHFFDLYTSVQGNSQWSTFQFTTEQGGNVSAAELEIAARELDEDTYKQEFQGDFVNLTSGLVYRAFDRHGNLRTLQYEKRLPLFWSLDFNVDPMATVIGQKCNQEVRVLEEMVLKDSNTETACAEFLKRTARWRTFDNNPIVVHIYGDATAIGRKSSASRTDWEIVWQFFARHSDRYKVVNRVGSKNPPVKDRVNCVNAKLKNYLGECTLFIDPSCKELIQDFERVHWRADSHGNMLADIDKSDTARTHVSDALGYMVAQEFGMQPVCGPKYGHVI